MLTGASPILVAADVLATLRFYTEVLGFTSSWNYGDPPTFGGASWGKVLLMFSQRPDLDNTGEGHEQWLDVDDIDALHAQHLERGAMIVSPIEDKPWGRREYTVRDPNGYQLRFGGNPSHTSKGSGVLPDGVEIVRRMPTVEEYDKVAGEAFYRGASPRGVLEQTWEAVIATDAEGAVIGTVRIMFDAPGWFSVWDVAVLPDWQGQRIGTAMMEAALEIIREESPGAIVYLFTFKHEFYQRMGFTKESVDTIRL